MRIKEAVAPSSMKGEILEASEKLFASRGFDGVSFRDITALCGAKRSLILYHFGSKEELWREAFKSVLARFDAALAARPVPLAECPDERRVSLNLRAMVDAFIEVPEFGQIILREGTAPSERLGWIVANFTPARTHDMHVNPAIVNRLRSSIRRNLVISALLGTTTLGPFFEASTVMRSGKYPLNEARREELVALLTRVIMEN